MRAAAAARSADGFSVPDGAQVATVRVLGQSAAVIYRADAGELHRRNGVGLGTITRLDLLDLLLNLPLGCAMAAESLTMRERRLLTDLPAGSIDVEPGLVTRRVAVPLMVDLALVPGRLAPGPGSGISVRAVLQQGSRPGAGAGRCGYFAD